MDFIWQIHVKNQAISKKNKTKQNKTETKQNKNKKQKQKQKNPTLTLKVQNFKQNGAVIQIRIQNISVIHR